MFDRLPPMNFQAEKITILVHFVEVRILTGLPFFLPFCGKKRQKT
jgi:hypothetical protein